MRGYNTSSTSISVSWEEVQTDLQNGIITGYNITYESQTENDNGVVLAGPNDRQANLTGLKEFVKYNISVVAFAVKGHGPPSLIFVTTDQDSKSYKTVFSFTVLLIYFPFPFDCLVSFFTGEYAPALKLKEC